MLSAQLGDRAAALAKFTGKGPAIAAARYYDSVLAPWRLRNAYRKDPLLRASLRQLELFRGRHSGETCVIIGNGPSLRRTDISLLRNVTTFGLNRVYLAFEDWGFGTTYHVSVNQHVARQSGSELAELSTHLFTTVDNLNTFRSLSPATTTYLWNRRFPGFYGDVRKGIWEGATVTYVAMQLAYFFGFRRVVLVGVDHRFASKGPAHRLVTSESPDENHFLPHYFGPGYAWQLPDLRTSELAYTMAKRAFEASGREIVDATVEGALDVFPKVELARALHPGRG